MTQNAKLWTGALAALLACGSLALAAQPPAVTGSLILTKTAPFKLEQPIKLDLLVGGIRVPELSVVREEGNLLDQVLPPRGGQSRYSWLRYRIAVENPSDASWTLAVRARLLDKHGAVIDEFEFRKRVGAGRARQVDFRRLTLNYVTPLVDQLELTLSAER